MNSLLGFLGLSASLVCSPELVSERKEHLTSLVRQIQQVVSLKEDPRFDFPFTLVGRRVRLPDNWPSPIYSRYRPGVCEIMFNDNEQTHQAYQELMARVEAQKPEMLRQAEYYVVGHELGHCVYNHLKAIKSPEIDLVFPRDDAHPDQHDDAGLMRTPPVSVTSKTPQLHAEIFADVYGIEFASNMLGDQAAGLTDVVIKFRQKVSAHDPTYYTQHYIKSCTEGQLDVLDILLDREDGMGDVAESAPISR